MRRKIAAAVQLYLLCGILVTLLGCKRGAGEAAPSSSASASASASAGLPAPVASGLPMLPEQISAIVNPKKEPVYSGPAGAVRGVVIASGDAPPEVRDVMARIGEDCAPAREVYGRLFREGTGRTLADVLVAVTGYKGYVPEQRSIVTVSASGCAWAARTVAVTFGQRIDIVAKDRKAYVPDLLGARMAAQLIALPGGAGSTVYPQQPGRFLLVDSMRVYSMAEVVVLKYATHDVTGLDGKFHIDRIPAGKVTVSALLPSTGRTVEQEVMIEPSRTLDLKFVLPFDLAQYKRPSATSAPSGAPSAAPAPPVR